MPNDQKLDRLIRQLIRKTTEGDCEWESAQPPQNYRSGTDNIIDDYFEANYKGKRIVVFERRYRQFDVDSESMYWTSSDHFGFVEGTPFIGEKIAWETSDRSYPIETLLKAAKESAAGVDDLIDDLLE